MRFVDRQRRQNRIDFVGEIIVQVFFLGCIEILPPENAYLGLGQGRNQFLVVQLVARLFQLLYSPENQPHLLVRCKPCGVRSTVSFMNAAQQGRHPYHEELVQIGMKDAEKPEPFEDGVLGIFRLFQHPPVELEPAQLAVQKRRLPGAHGVLDASLRTIFLPKISAKRSARLARPTLSIVRSVAFSTTRTIWSPSRESFKSAAFCSCPLASVFATRSIAASFETATR